MINKTPENYSIAHKIRNCASEISNDYKSAVRLKIQMTSMKEILFLTFFLLSFFFSTSRAINSAIAIDIGTQFMKIALVKPGVPMEIVLNKESKRKTPFALAIRNGERFFGESAMQMAMRRPKHVYTFFFDLIGKSFDDPIVTAYRNIYPHLTLIPDERRNSVLFQTDNGTLPVETMVAMVLWNSLDIVEEYTNGAAVTNAVITVPAYFDDTEKQVLTKAAEIAGIKLLGFLTSGSAAGLNYGVFRRKELSAEKPQTFLIYDCGATNTIATVVQFMLIKEEGVKELVPVVKTLGVGFNRTLGGNEITFQLREHLVNEFQKTHKTTKKAVDDPQAMAKLWKEAERVKQVLSANIEHYAQIENVMEDQNFRMKVTREELEQMARYLEPHFMQPIDEAIKAAKLGLDEIDQIVLMGAGTRMPRIQQLLSDLVKGKELGRFLNTDEAIALGAVYHAAALQKGFRVKRFDVKEYEKPNNTEAEKGTFTGWLSSLSSGGDVETSEKAQNITDQKARSEQILMNSKEIEQAKKILSDYEQREKAKAERDSALNSLESAVYDYQAKLEETEFTRFGTNEELETLKAEVLKLKEWLDDGMDTEVGSDELKTKKRELDTSAKKIRYRRRQKEDRPKMVEKLEKSLKETQTALDLFKTETVRFAKLAAEDAEARLKSVPVATSASSKGTTATDLPGELNKSADKQLNDTQTENAEGEQGDKEKKDGEKELKDDKNKETVDDKKKEQEPKTSDDEILEKLLQPSPYPSPLFTEIELSALEKLLHNVRDWFDTKRNEQTKKAENEDPILTITDIKDKIGSLDREVKYLANKLYSARRKEDTAQSAKKLREQMEKIKADMAKEKKNKTGDSLKTNKTAGVNDTLPSEAEPIPFDESMFADILQDKEEVQSENESPFTDSAEATTEKTDATSEKEKVEDTPEDTGGDSESISVGDDSKKPKNISSKERDRVDKSEL